MYNLSSSPISFIKVKATHKVETQQLTVGLSDGKDTHERNAQISTRSCVDLHLSRISSYFVLPLSFACSSNFWYL